MMFGAEWKLGAQSIDAQYPADMNWVGALSEAFICSDEAAILRVVIRKDRFATREPGFLGPSRYSSWPEQP